MWDIPLPQTPDPKPTLLHSVNLQSSCPPQQQLPPIHNQTINVILCKDKVKQDLATYLHAACFSLTKATLIQAIKNNFLVSWPGLTADLIRKHLPTSVSTAMGHLNQERSGLRSTKQHANEITEVNNFFPPSPQPNIKSNEVIYTIVNTQDKGFFDLPGRFPICSSRGNQYLVIAYHYDANAILGMPIKNRQAATITAAWKAIHSKLSKAAAAPSIWVLDNEASMDLKTAMEKKDTKYQLVPPYTHRANAAERAIQTFKNHFKAGLASIDPDYPMKEWDCLLDQCFLTLNLLRGSRANPSLSAYAYLFGMLIIMQHPLLPRAQK